MLLKNESSKFKVILSFTLFILVLTLAYIGCDNRSKKVISVTSISIEQKAINLYVGETDSLTVIIQPENATNKEVKWTSDDNEIVTVSAEGKITALSIGEARITVTSIDGNHEAFCIVTVTEKHIPVQEITFDFTELTLIEGETWQLTVTIIPENATNQEVIWSSSDNEVVAVSQDGEITAVAVGEAVISVTSIDGEHETTCIVTVTEDYIPIIEITLDYTELSLIEGETWQLNITINPENATNQDVIWSSSDDEAVTVSHEGEITAVAVGEAIITVTSTDGEHEATCIVTVTDEYIPIIDITLDHIELSLVEGEMQQLIVIITPENATNQGILWSSSNILVASISKDGIVTALLEGQTTITVTTAEGDHTAECIVTVLPIFIPVENISLDYEEIVLEIDSTQLLNVIFTPWNATNQEVIWHSSNPFTVHVSDSGLITTINGGRAIISVTSVDGGHTAHCSLMVTISGSFIVENFNQWDNALNQIINDTQNTVYTIVVVEDFYIIGTDQNTFGDRSGIEVSITGTNTISLIQNTIGNLLKISNNQSVILNNIQLKGLHNNETSLVYIGGENANLIMCGYASISENVSYSSGGGVHVTNNGTITLSDHSSIHSNSTGNGVNSIGGGIYSHYGNIYLSGYASIHNNTSRYRGGGIRNDRGNIYMSGNSSIYNNTHTGTQNILEGGGVSSHTIPSIEVFLMSDNSSIYENTATLGGGVFGNVTMIGSSSIYNNTASGPYYYGWGGGVVNGLVQMYDNSSIYGNNAREGGGIYGSVNMHDNSSIYGNTASHRGGGFINTENGNTLDMSDNTKIYENTAQFGGGIALTHGHVYINDNSSIFRNTSINRGGGIYVDNLIDDVWTFLPYPCTITFSGGIIYGSQGSGTPEEFANISGNDGATLYRVPRHYPSIKYGDGDDVLPHIDENLDYTNYTIEGRE